MPNNKAKVQDELPPEWMSEEASRAQGQGEAGKLVNETAASRRRPAPRVKHAPRERVLKGFRPSRDRAATFDTLVAEQKNTSGKRGPELIDEALDLLFKHYRKELIQ